MTSARSLAAGVVAVTLLLGVAACAESDSTSPTAASTAPGLARDLSSYDAFVIASAENNPLFADVYGLRFEPLAAERITTMKRISTMGADAERIVVAAADGDVDRLAVVTGDGSLVPVPGLGRPHAFAPVVKDGTIYYEVLADDDVSRTLAFDLAQKTKKVLFKSRDLPADIRCGRANSCTES